MIVRILAIVLAIALSTNAPAATESSSRKDAASHAAMRLLKAECFSCHNGEKHKGGLVLSTRERLIEGGDSGAVVVPGKPDASLLAKVLSKDADPHMPPKKQLTDAQVKVLRDWIKRGATWNEAALSEEEPVAPVSLVDLPASYAPVLAMALSPDGARLAIGRGGRVVLYDVVQTNFPVVTEWVAHQDAIQSLAWSKDSRSLASGGFRRVALWDAGSFKLTREWTNGLAGRISAIELVGAAEPRLVVADGVETRGSFLRVFSVNDGKLIRSWRAHEDAIFDMDLSRDGNQLVTAGGDKLIKIWDVAQMKETSRLEGHAGHVLAVAFNTNATWVVSGGADKELKVWDVKTREKIISLGRHTSAVTAVAWPGEGKSVVAVTDGGGAFTYKNLKAHSGEQSSAGGDERKLGEVGDAVLCVAASPDAKQIFAGSYDGFVQVWNSEGKLLARMNPSPAVAELGSAVSQASAAAGKSNVRATATSRPRASFVSLKASSVVSLQAEPTEIVLSADAPRHGVLITATTTDGFERDVTSEVRFVADRSAPFEVSATGEIRSRRPGTGKLTAKFKGKMVEIPVTVRGSESSGAPTNTVAYACWACTACKRLACAVRGSMSCPARCSGGASGRPARTPHWRAWCWV